MNTAKSYKFILLITALIMSLVTAITMMSFNSVKADTINITPDAYFNYAKTTTAEFKNDNAVFTLTENDTIVLENTIAVNDFFMNFKMGEGVKGIKLSISANSYFVNGNKSTDGKYDTEIVNEVSVNADGTAKFNDNSLITATAGKIYMSVKDNGFYKASVNGIDYVSESNAYYRVETSNEYNKLSGKVNIEVILEDNVDTATFEVISLSQKASDATYLQTFKFTDNALTEAKPIVSLSNDFKVSSGKAIIYNVNTEIPYNVYSILDGYTKNSTKIEAGVYVNQESGKVHFSSLGDNQLKITDKNDETNVYLTVQLNVLDESAETEKPVYTFNQSAYDAFIYALEKQYTVIDDKGTPDDKTDDEKHCVPLGTTITIPSLEDFVSDDYTTYGDLGVEMYYATPNSTAFATKKDMKLTLSDAGDYTFFVMFKDAKGSMDKGDFIIEEDGKEDKINNAVYGKFVFSFHVVDGAPIIITPASVQGKGYKGTSYTASKFTVDASGCAITYKLFYNPSIDAVEDSNGWVEIPASASINDTDYNENGYSYDDVKKIAYNGTLTFTPDKIGSYKIVCYANSKITAREASASTIIKIGNEPTVVRPASEWLQNNVWSVVFLSIGTLCLIGIIVLLCIKPKEEKDN